jgi:radical SAM protein (TIGR01212 family)
LGLQSSFDATLERVNRAHNFEDFSQAMDLCDGRGFEICIHVILGLPGETAFHYRRTACSLIRWKYHSLKIHPLHVVKGTVLAHQFQNGQYIPMEKKSYVQGLVDFLERVPPQVGIQRFTGDAPESMLLAPLWCRDKSKLQEAMLAEFHERDTWQGYALGYPKNIAHLEAIDPARDPVH